MGDLFKVITDIDRIESLNKQLVAQLKQKFKFMEAREVGYPSGHQMEMVYFEHSSGSSVRAWSPSKKDGNFILVPGEPGSTRWMEILVQLNFPTGKYSRHPAGAFVSDENDKIFVAHRGRLTKGKGRLKTVKVFREFAAQTIEARDNEKTSTLILISALDDQTLVSRLWAFAEEAREVATRLRDEGTQSLTDDGLSSPSSKNKEQGLMMLRNYYDEYAGEGDTKGYGGGKRSVEHGDVVKALEAQLSGKGKSQKAQAIDLAIVTAAKVDLFEVKTSGRTTDVYTGVGQLLIHGECIHKRLGLPVKRHLVLPAQPRESHGWYISERAKINIVTYQRVGKKYQFTGLSVS